MYLKDARHRVKSQTDFYGTIFEIDMASRCLLSGWDIRFVEDYVEQQKQIDFVFFMKNKPARVSGVECLSKRYTANSLTIKKINSDINSKADKYEEECMQKLSDKLGVSLDQRLLVIDITKPDYSIPDISVQLDTISRSSRLDGVVFTWRQDFTDGDDHSLRVQYKTVGNVDKGYFSTTYAAEFHKGPVFFMRKYVYPEPSVSWVQPEERLEDYQHG